MIRSAARQLPAVLLTGARQTGKTSLLQQLFPTHKVVTLDLPSEAEEAEKDGASFLARHGTPLVIDEVQYALGLFRHLKVAIERNRSTAGQYFLTGSQKFPLMKGISESLAGRVVVLELEALSFSEIHAAHPHLPVEDVVLRGGYPELYRDLSLNRALFYRSYVATYLERDLRSILNVSSLRDFERFLRACALRSGQLLNKAELARDVGISPSTANHWISVLSASNLMILLEPWFSNRTRSITRSPKLYLADTGVLLSLLNIESAEDLFRSPLLGAIWETFVFSELRRRQIAHDGSWSIHFFRDRGIEVDFLVHRGGRFDLYEAKWTEHPSSRDLAGIAGVTSYLGEKNIASKTVISRTRNPFPIGEGVRACGVGDL